MTYGLKHNGWESSQRLASGSASLPPCFSSAAHGAVGSDPICLSRHWGIDLLGRGTFQEVIPALEWFPIRQPYVEVTKTMKICLQSWIQHSSRSFSHWLDLKAFLSTWCPLAGRTVGERSFDVFRSYGSRTLWTCCSCKQGIEIAFAPKWSCSQGGTRDL